MKNETGAMIEFKLNGRWVKSCGVPEARLLDILRDEFSLSGPKEGCGEGECGACSVFVNGRLVASCIVPLISVSGGEVMTIEGFSQTEHYRILEQCFDEAGAVQCGFCTPGMILASHALLCERPDPTDEQIREGLSGNLCRCTGYNMIVDAVRMAAQKGKGLW